MNDCFHNNYFITVILEYIYWCDNLTTSHILSPLAGIWIKPSRTSRMREKRADFVAGCLGGRVIAAGGLGQHIHSFPYITFILNWWLNWAQTKDREGREHLSLLLPSSVVFFCWTCYLSLWCSIKICSNFRCNFTGRKIRAQHQGANKYDLHSFFSVDIHVCWILN